MNTPGDQLQTALKQQWPDPGTPPGRTRPNFGWTAAFVIFAWSPLVVVGGLTVIRFHGLVPPLRWISGQTVGEYMGIVIAVGWGALAILGLPILARYHRAGFWRGTGAVLAGLLHMIVGVGIPMYVSQASVIAVILLDAVAAVICAFVIRQRRRAAAAARLKLLDQFD